MNIKDKILVQGIITNNKELIPIWDERIRYEYSEDYGSRIYINGDRHKYYNTTSLIFDLETKKLSQGIIIDIYPKLEEREYKINESVLIEGYENGKRWLYPTKIIDIQYKEYKDSIYPAEKMDEYYKQFIKCELIVGMLYTIRVWEPTYILENGTETKWEHQLYRMKKI